MNNQIVGYLAGLTNLESLRIDASTITDEGLTFLSGMQRLKYLTISCQVTDAGLAELNKLKSLRMLQIASPDVTKEGLEALERQMPSLQDVNHFTYRLHGQKVSRSVRDDFWRVGAPEDRPIKDVLEGNSPPEIAASKWLNAQSGDMTWDKLDGKVVLLSFWNQQRQAVPRRHPHVEASERQVR